MHLHGPQALCDDVHRRDLCVGCGACVGLCPYFRSYQGRIAMLFPCDRDSGRCHAYCPKTEVDLDALARQGGAPAYPAAPAGDYIRILAARAGDRLAGPAFQSGGTVTALMTLAMEKGMVESAVLTDRNGLEPLPVLATCREQIARCASSKYTAAPTLAALNSAIQAGRRRIGVVGTPCQLTAVAQMRGNPLRVDGFHDPIALVIGLFCTWALDTRKLTALIAPMMDTGRIRKMTIPPPPAERLIIETDAGRAEIPLDRVRPLIPAGCRVCVDMTAEWSDLSVGELEGRPQWNTLIVRSAAGQALVEQAVQEGWLETEPYPPDRLKHLMAAALGKKRRALTRLRDEGWLNSAAGANGAVLRLDAKCVAALIDPREE